ncbi:hypothetical protein C1H46_018828 [Malus baccata]|uniref:Uncharacterized protein n=1 Tax=Malus baccata TaxID=106549 RepID=A0A540M9W3_MALBA|nr:hypothetical protein C1H46_018828 [Malus baccata]
MFGKHISFPGFGLMKGVVVSRFNLRKGLSRMNHHHPRQIPFKYPEQDCSLPPSASTADNPFDISLPASRCGGSLPNLTTPYSPDRYYFSKTPSRISTTLRPRPRPAPPPPPMISTSPPTWTPRILR